MKLFKLHAMVAIVVCLCVSTVIFAQSAPGTNAVADKYLISAKAGGVNHVEGSVSIIRASGKSGVLLKRDRVEIGDRVMTGGDGKAEVLLNPGSYIRLGRNSSFEFGSTDLEDLQITLDAGSAMFEVFADNEFRVSVFTPKGKVSLVDTGIYRIDVSTDGNALLAVTKGKAEVGTTLVKEGRTGTVGGETVAVAKFDKDKRDDLGEWSKARSKELGKVTSSFRDRDITRILNSGFGLGAWSFNNSFGLWMYSPAFGGYCFLPFGNGWRSPYGWWYERGIYYNPYFYPYNPTHYPPTPTGPSNKKIRTAGDYPPVNPNAKVRGNESVRDTDPARSGPPPFAKVNRGGGDVPLNTGVNMKGGDFSSPSSSPSYSPPMSAPVSAPAPSTAKVRDN